MNKAKAIHLADFLVFLYFFIIALVLYGGNYWNGDRDAYELYYQRDSIAPWGIELLYGYLNIFFHSMGVPFQTFQVIVAFFTIFLTSIYLKKVSLYFSISFFAYFLLMFPLDYVLMRTSLAYAIVLNAFLLLYDNKKIQFSILIVIATLIHQSAFIFLIFVVNNKNHENIKVCKYTFYATFLIIISQLLTHYGLLAEKIVNHFSYYQTTWKTIVGSLFFHILSVYLIVFDEKNRSNQVKYQKFIRNINIISLLLLCLYFQADIFVRVFRLLVFINIVYLLQSICITKKSTYYGSFYILFFSVYLFYYYIYLTLGYSLIPLFNFNFLTMIG
ncbi:EpsG family protein [Serratia aquatilis]|uniref:EpsG family protein n=1 Tax=Serratia aquatilis TaxID=1737515 RepID=A0ABV6EJU2_9GAMM